MGADVGGGEADALGDVDGRGPAQVPLGRLDAGIYHFHIGVIWSPSVARGVSGRDTEGGCGQGYAPTRRVSQGRITQIELHRYGNKATYE